MEGKNMAWTNEDTFRFIELYQNKPIIWNPRNKRHNDRNLVDQAWNRIAEAMDIPVSVLKRKKKTLMTTFRFHYKKKLQTIRRCKMGQAKHVYTPIWTFYEPLESFLQGVYENKTGRKIRVKRSKSRRDEDDDDDEDEDDEEEEEQEQAEEEEPEGEEISEEQRKESQNDVNNKKLDIPIINRCSNFSLVGVKEASREVSSAFNVLNRIFKNKLRKNEEKNMDECELYGKLLAKKLRQFSDTERQDIMYELDGLLLNRCIQQSPSSPPLQIIINEHPNSASDSNVSPSQSPTQNNKSASSNSKLSIKSSPLSPQSDPLQSSSSHYSTIPKVSKTVTS